MIFFLVLVNIALIGGLALVWGRGPALPVKSKKPVELAEPYLCPVWETQFVQMKMVEAGIINETQVSVCDESNCPGCQHVKKAANKVYVELANERYPRFRRYLTSSAINEGDLPTVAEVADFIIETVEVWGRGEPLRPTRNCLRCGLPHSVFTSIEECRFCNGELL